MESILLFIPAVVLRLVSANQSFWLDEGASLAFARLPLSSLFESLKGDFHPPLYYLILHFWLFILRSFSEVGPMLERTEWLIRLPNIIAGALCVPVLYKLLTELLSKEKKKVALIASLLLLVNPLHIYYSAELRMYSLNALFSLLSWLYLLRALKDKTKNHLSWRYFILFSVLNLYTFYGALFNLAAQWFFTYWQYRKKLKPLLVSNLITAIFFLPWVPVFLKQLSAGGYLTKVLPGWGQLSGNLSLKSLGLIMAKFTFGRISMANKGAYAVFVGGISLYFLLSSYLTSLTKEGKALLVWFYASLAFAILVSLRAPVLGYWRFVFLIPAFVSIIALGLSVLPPLAYRLNLFVVFLVFVLGNLIFWVTPSLHREDWRAAGKLVGKDNSLSIVNFPDVFAPLKFYASDTYFYPDQERLGKMRADLDQSLPLVLLGKDTVFIFDYLSDLTDKKRTILTWLKRAGFKQNPTHNINGVGFIYEFSSPN